MTRIRDKKLQYDINREAAKISPFLPGRVAKYECLTDEPVLPSDKLRVIEQVKLTYSSFTRSFRKVNKKYWRSRQKANKSTWRVRKTTN